MKNDLKDRVKFKIENEFRVLKSQFLNNPDFENGLERLYVCQVVIDYFYSEYDLKRDALEYLLNDKVVALDFLYDMYLVGSERLEDLINNMIMSNIKRTGFKEDDYFVIH